MPAELSQLRLVDSMMHEARNPLNAIAIHLEIVSEKLRKSGASVNIDSNLQAMRSQLARVDELLKKFASFMLPKKRGDGAFPLSSAGARTSRLRHGSKRDWPCRPPSVRQLHPWCWRCFSTRLIGHRAVRG